MTDQHWRQHAACRGADPELFFPPPLGADTARHIQQVRAICDPCPVRQQCLDFALECEVGKPPYMRFGIVAGLTPQQRFELWQQTSGQLRAHKPRETNWARRDRQCTVDGCDDPVHARDRCRRHYRRWQMENRSFKHGTTHGYNHGCRCGDCAAAANELEKRKWAQRRQEVAA